MKTLMLSILMLACSSVFAKTAVVLSTKNAVQGSIQGANKLLKRGDALKAGDSINTGGGAIARIKYSNGTLVSIAPNSSYKILAYAPDAEVQIKAELTKGTMVSKTNGKTKESLKTPVIAMAILGTKYATTVTSPKQTYIKVIQGSVQAGNRTLGPGDSVMASPSGVVDAEYPNNDFLEEEMDELEYESEEDEDDDGDDGDDGDDDEGDDDEGDDESGDDDSGDDDTGGDDDGGDTDSDSGSDSNVDTESGADTGPEGVFEDVTSSFTLGEEEDEFEEEF